MVLIHGDRTAMQRKETCVLLAGGAGRRLGHLTGGGNKHLIEVDGRPALDHVLDTIVATESVEKLVVVTTPECEAPIEDLVGPARAHLHVVVRTQARPTGTLDAVVTAVPDIEHEAFSVHYGDNFFGWRCLPPLDAALPEGASASVCTVRPPADWRRYATVLTRTRADGRAVATCLEEKPAGQEPSGPFRSLSGLFRFDTRAFRREAPLVPISPRGEFELTDLVRRMLPGGRVHAIPVELAWVDFGTEAGFREALAVIGARGLSRA